MKLNKKLTSILVTGAMIASIGGTTAMTSFAEGPAVTFGPDANLVKYLEMADDVQNPNQDFEFTFTGVSINKDETKKPENVTYTMNSSTFVDTDADDADSIYGAVPLATILEGQFDHAGVYVYDVSETKGGTSTEDKTWDNDKDVYRLTIAVINEVDEDGKPTGALKVDNVIAQKLAEDGTLPENAPKVDVGTTDPTVDPDKDKDPDAPQSPDNGEEAENGTTIYGFTFDNNYEVTLGEKYDPETQDPDDYDATKAALNVTKTVEGSYADLTYEFPFAIEFTAPANYTGATTVNAIVNGEEATLDLTESNDFVMKNGGTLVIPQLPAGIQYKVTEKLADATVENRAAYQASYAVTGATETANTADKGASLATNAITLAEDNANDKVDYTNKLDDDDVTPTGILMQNAPYILVATLAAGGLVIYLAKRREEEEEA